MSIKNVLITVSGDTCGNLKLILEEKTDYLLHLPLENYRSNHQKRESDVLLSASGNFSFVVYGNLRNARHFMNWVQEYDKIEEFQNLVHFSMDEPTFKFLEESGIPSIMPRENARPVDILEFMLRIKREGKTLYPTAEKKAEEMPGLLNELQMKVTEFSVCLEVTLDQELLNEYKSKVKMNKPDTILFHNRSSITRTKAAFPDLNLHQMKILSGSAGVTQRLEEIGLEPEYEAEGTWRSIGGIVLSLEN